MISLGWDSAVRAKGRGSAASDETERQLPRTGAAVGYEVSRVGAVNSLQSHPGHYAGSVRVGAHVVPVEIRVLDFELPAPKGYLKPALDYRVSSYNYYAWDIILAYNGGDIRQVFAAYANYRREDTA